MADDFFVTARRRLVQLKALHEAGTLDAATYENERRAVERDIGNHLSEAAPADGATRPSRRLVAALSLAVIAVALAGYWKTGSPSLVGANATVAAAPDAGPPDAAAAASDAGATGLQQIAAMVDKLAARMKDRPDDAEGWTMLARSYTVLGRFAEALPAYARASQLQPKNATLLADYADAVAATKGTANNPESIALVERALAVDPEHPKALALAGTALYDRGDYAGAIARWQKIADRLPPESELAKQIQSSIVEARGHLPSGSASAPTIALAPTPIQTPTVTPATTAALSGIVTLDAALAGKASPGDTVFVFARSAGGSRMPLAVQRAKVSDLPLSFKLDDSMAMAPGATLSSARQVIVGARISKTGNAMPQAGDLSGEVAPVAPGTSGVAIRIDRVVGAGP
ncbi:MAG: c-type cytochrome biogenesis protein CcmI [Caldimonas sp.]